MRKLKYPQRMSLSNWTRTEKKLLSERVFRWCKKNMGINRRYKIPISLSVVRDEKDARNAEKKHYKKVIDYLNKQ